MACPGSEPRPESLQSLGCSLICLGGPGRPPQSWGPHSVRSLRSLGRPAIPGTPGLQGHELALSSRPWQARLPLPGRNCLPENPALPSGPSVGHLLQAVFLDSPRQLLLAPQPGSPSCHCQLTHFPLPQTGISSTAETELLTPRPQQATEGGRSKWLLTRYRNPRREKPEAPWTAHLGAAGDSLGFKGRDSLRAIAYPVSDHSYCPAKPQ